MKFTTRVCFNPTTMRPFFVWWAWDDTFLGNFCVILDFETGELSTRDSFDSLVRIPKNWEFVL